MDEFAFLSFWLQSAAIIKLGRVRMCN